MVEPNPAIQLKPSQRQRRCTDIAAPHMHWFKFKLLFYSNVCTLIESDFLIYIYPCDLCDFHSSQSPTDLTSFWFTSPAPPPSSAHLKRTNMPRYHWVYSNICWEWMAISGCSSDVAWLTYERRCCCSCRCRRYWSTIMSGGIHRKKRQRKI